MAAVGGRVPFGSGRLGGPEGGGDGVDHTNTNCEQIAY